MLRINKHSSELMHEYNRKLVYNLVRISKKTTRVELAKETKLSAMTVTRIINVLKNDNLLIETDAYETNPGPGRPAAFLAINPHGILAIGVSVDIDEIEAGVVSVDGKVIIKEKCKVNKNYAVGSIVEIIIITVKNLKNQLTTEQKGCLKGIGVSFTGVVEWPKGIVRMSPQIGWKNVDLRQLLEENFDIPVLVENDVKAAALCENLFGDHKRNFIVITWGSGFGAAIISEGEIYRGVNNVIGEIGHIVVNPNGEICDCGRRGCLQTICAIREIEKQTGKKFSTILDLAAQGEKESMDILNNAIEHISMWIANLYNIYNPSEILIYGKVVEIWDNLIPKINETHKKYLWEPFGDGLEIKKASASNDSMRVLSAASIVFHEFINPNVAIDERVIM